VRYSLGSHRWGGPDVNNEVLQQWNIYPKSAALSGARDPGTISFMITKRNRRNTLFNFAARLVRKGFRDAGELEIEEFQAAIKPFWSTILACSRLWARDAGMSSRPLLNNGGPDEDRCLIQLNFSSLLWKRAPVDQPIFRCDHCGRLAFYSIKAICPIRDCQGTLKSILPEEIDASRFSPVRHYRKLIAATSMTPLHVEEHTAQISAVKRDAVEREFRSTQPDSVDVICGSTTFELGIDLGSIQSVFMSNLPPRAANYRQRAGRAGRRVGAQPFILNYVRQRPHDQYFWNSLQAFIGGPLPVPRLAISSLEVVRRHAYAILIAHLLELYREGHPGRMGLTGPPAGSFVEFTLASITNTQICRELEATHPLAVRLDRFLKKV